MYLVELDDDGIVKFKGQDDGLMAVKEFRDVINSKRLGIKCFTCIALVADHLTSIRYYTDKDRPLKAMYMIMNNRRAFNWPEELIQVALIKYEELQYNPVLEEKVLLMQMQMDKLNEIKTEKSNDKKIELFKQLGTIKGLIDNFNKQHLDEDPYASGPVVGGYSLSRLEEKLLDNKSFYNASKERVSKN